jgi:FkbM family methyltransferase
MPRMQKYVRIARTRLGNSCRSLARILKNLTEKLAKAAGIEEVRGHHVSSRSLDAESFILDLGANHGDFSHEISRRWGCRCLAVEASFQTFQSIRETDLVTKLNCAVAGASGPVSFFESSNSEASSFFSEIAESFGVEKSYIVNAVTYRDLLLQANLPVPAVLKLDIEGAELSLLQSLDQNDLESIEQITVEFHDFVAGFGRSNEIDVIRRRLRAAGFVHLRMGGALNCDDLFLNKRRRRVTLSDRAKLGMLEGLLLPVLIKFERWVFKKRS